MAYKDDSDNFLRLDCFKVDLQLMVSQLATALGMRTRFLKATPPKVRL